MQSYFLKPINRKQDISLDQNNKILNKLNTMANKIPVATPLKLVWPTLETGDTNKR